MMWWGWIVLGLIMLGAEMFLIDAQFYLVFIGLSAIVVGLLGLLGMSMPDWGQWMLFAALSLASMFTFRKSLYLKVRGTAPGFDAGVDGETLQIPVDLAPGDQGRASHRGTQWTVRNVGSGPIAAGERVNILKTEGLILHVSKGPAD